MTSVKDDAYSEPEVVQRSFEVACRRRRAGDANGAEVGEVEPHRIVINLKQPHVYTWRDAHVETAANRAGQTGVLEIFERVIKLCKVSGSSTDADKRMRERFPPSFGRVVLHLSTAEDVVQPDGSVVAAKAK